MDWETKYYLMKEGGEILGKILKILKENVQVGKNGEELNKLAEELIYSFGAKPAFKNYQAPFARKPYPYSLCLSLNEIIVHGYPTKEIVLKEGDVVKIDLGINYQGVFLDASFTTTLGEVSEEVKKLVLTTKKALIEAFKIIKPGIKTGDIGWKIESTLEDEGLGVIRELCGHEIGEMLHGELQIWNFGDPGQGKVIKPGMFFTLEPMASLGSGEIEQVDDYLFKTKDNTLSAHFEATISVLEDKAEILTPIDFY